MSIILPGMGLQHLFHACAAAELVTVHPGSGAVVWVMKCPLDGWRVVVLSEKQGLLGFDAWSMYWTVTPWPMVERRE